MATLSSASHPDDPCACAPAWRSPAKINLTLAVLGRRPDGYHDLRSLVLGVGLHDELTFRLAATDRVTLHCDDPDLPMDDRNLVLQAARLLPRTTTARPGVTIDLKKRIPVAAGLGGGSGNAAATLAALNRLWGLGLSISELSRLGARLGADVPLFFSLPCARISGRGDCVQAVRIGWSGWVLLVFAGCPVSTKDVYAAWSPQDSPQRLRDPADAILRSRSADEAAGHCCNDLEAAVFRVAPRVEALFDAVSARARGVGVGPVRVSGAGQTVYVLFDDPDEARSFQARLRSEGVGTGSCLVQSGADPLLKG